MTSTDQLVLRPAREDDQDQIISVYLSARRAAPMPPLTHTEAATAFWVARKLQSSDETWVAEVASEVVGFARLAADWLDDLYVAPPYAGQGIGSALLDLVKSLRPAGFCLWVFEMNQPARRFYAARGLVELSHTDGRSNEEQAPDVQLAWPGREPLSFLRGLVDEVDDELGDVLERRAALTALIQHYKPVGGPSGRDAEREREIARHLAERAPRLGAARLERIIHTVIAESLDAAESTGRER